jgi:hypothetical protein
VELLFLLIPLVLAAILFISLGLFVQRASKALAQTRAVAGFQRDASELATRIDGTLEQLVTRVDAVRRQQVAPGEIQAELRSGLDAMAGYLEEARKIRTPDELAETRNLIAQDIQRGARALEMVVHGVRLWTGGYGRQSEMEAQTAIKRGYLNLLHARETVGEHLTDLAEARAAGDRKWRTSRI